MKKVCFLVITVLIVACRSDNSLPDGFVYLDEYVPEIITDLRYYSSDNFIGDTITGYEAPRCIISKEAAKALRKVQNELGQLDLRLKIFDAYRPQMAVDHFVSWAKDLGDTIMKPQYYPQVPKNILFDEGYIAARSGHSRGSTVDLTLVDNNGNELDMGTPWDYFGPESWLANGNLTTIQVTNRMLFQTIMLKHGFQPYDKEWWHFTLKDEPFPETYFNFPVK